MTKQTLLDFQEEIEDLHPFVTFIVKDGETIISYATMAWCRFRSYSDKIYEVRSCDCDGQICGHPPQLMYMDKTILERYVLTDRDNQVHLKFTYDVGR